MRCSARESQRPGGALEELRGAAGVAALRGEVQRGLLPPAEGG